MSSDGHTRFRALLAVLLLAGLRAPAQFRREPVEEPRLLTLRIDQASVGLLAEAYEQTVDSPGSSSTQTRLFFGPLIGLGLSGSIYHPNLFAYQITSDGSFGWSEDTYKGAVNSTDQRLRYVGSFIGTAKLLDNKPFNGNLFGGYTQTYQDYDFFNRIYIDRWRYGGGLRYSVGPLSLSGTAYHENEDATGYGTPLKSESITAASEATYHRELGSTTLAGTLTSYKRNDFGYRAEGTDYTLSAGDTEEFGSRKQLHSLVHLSLNHLENSFIPTDLYNALGTLRAEHTERLSSQYTVNYARNTYGTEQTDNLNGSTYLQHRLFESLTSQLNVQGYRYSTRSASARQDSWQFGGGPDLNYVKKIGSSSALSLHESFSLLHTDVESSGAIIPVVDEQYSFGTGLNGSFTLRQPNVITSTIQVRDATRVYSPLTDYEVFPNGQLTIIQRRTTSTILEGASVLVSYSFTASPSGAYDTLVNAFGIRFDMFNHHWAIFTRVNITQNYGGANLILQDLNDWVFGTEGSWRFLRAGVEYEIYDSNLSPFTALRFFQTLSFRPEENSSLSLNLTETFLDYEQSGGRKEQNYAAILRYNHGLTHHLVVNLELGADQRVGRGLDQTLLVARPQLQYTAGKLSATIGYDFGYDEYLGTEKRIRNLGFIRVRREF